MSLTDSQIAELASTQTIDLTTFGRRSGEKRRIEIWWFRFEDRFIITGTPGARHWLANVRADPSVIVHVNGDDYPASVVEIRDEDFRRRFFDRDETRWYVDEAGLDRLVATSPMVEVLL